MRYPSTRYLGKTWVGWINVLLLQWMCIRLQGNMVSDRKLESWDVIIVLPMTGWWFNYYPRRYPTFTVWSFKN